LKNRLAVDHIDQTTCST